MLNNTNRCGTATPNPESPDFLEREGARLKLCGFLLRRELRYYLEDADLLPFRLERALGELGAIQQELEWTLREISTSN